MRCGESAACLARHRPPDQRPRTFRSGSVPVHVHITIAPEYPATRAARQGERAECAPQRIPRIACPRSLLACRLAATLRRLAMIQEAPRSVVTTRPDGRRPMGHSTVALLCLGHLVTDINQGALPALLPFLIAEYGLTYTAAGFSSSPPISRPRWSSHCSGIWPIAVRDPGSAGRDRPGRRGTRCHGPGRIAMAGSAGGHGERDRRGGLSPQGARW